MTALHATARLLRDAAESAALPGRVRSDWARRLRRICAKRCAVPEGELRVRVSRQVRVGAGGRMLRALCTASDGRRMAVRLKWCPDGDPEALRATAANLAWWRERHPELCGPVPELVDFWDDERVMVLAEQAGTRLGADGRASPRVVERIAAWMRRYAAGHGRYGAEVDSRLRDGVFRTESGELRIDAAALLRKRIELARRSAAAWVARGWRDATRWEARIGCDAVVSAYASPQPAGFVHGDFKPGNVLTTDDDFAIIDWWIAPCVSWPLTDVATFAGNLWMENSPISRRIWNSFARAYFLRGIDGLTARTIDLIATGTCLESLTTRRSRRLFERLIDPHTRIGEIDETEGGNA